MVIMIRDFNVNSILTGWLNYAKGQLNILDPQTKALAEKRLAICEACPKRQTNQCGICGCFIPAKVSDPNAKCPDNPSRW